MATYTKFQCFVEDVAEKKHNLGSDQLVVALSNVAPVNTNTVLANLTQVAYTYCSTRNLTTATSAQTAGTYKLVVNDLTLTASGGAVGPFQYVTVYNDAATNDELIAFYNYGSSITLADGETILLNFDGSNGLCTIA